MAAKTFYLTSGTASNSNHHSLQDGGSAPADSTLTTGWVVAQTSPTVYARMDSGTERAASAQGATAQPDGAPDNTLGDCFRSASTLNGTFANTNWSLSFQVEGISRATSTHDGLIRVRIWKSSSETGASATELTAATQSSSQYTNLTNTTPQTVTITWTPGATKTLTNEYLFIQVAHQLDGAGNNNNCDTHLCVGSSNYITTSDFTPAATNWTKTISNTVQSADTVTKARTISRTKTSTVQAADTLSKILSKIITLTDTTNISDSIVGSLIKSLLLSDSVNVADVLSKARELYKLITDTINSSDTITSARNIVRVISNSINISDLLGTTVSGGAVIWQYSYPISDVTSGVWLNELDSYIDIYTSIDETVANDTDYIKSSAAPVSASYTTLMSGLGTPITKTDHTLYYRYASTISGAVDLTVKLIQGVTEIATWVHSGVGTDWVTAEQSLTQGQMDAITDYTDLKITFIADA